MAWLARSRRHGAERIVVGDNLAVPVDAPAAEFFRQRTGNRQRMPAADRGNGRRQVFVEMGITRAGNMPGGIGAPPRLRVAQDEAAVHDHPARVVEMPGQGFGVDESG